MLFGQKISHKMIPVNQLIRGKYQPRQNFDKNALEALAATIKDVGILEPLLVRFKTKNTYEIIAGERRWRGAQLAGLHEVPCIIGEYTDEAVIKLALIENLLREDLNPIEEARGIEKIINEFDYSHEKIAEVLGKSRTEVTNLLRLLKLDDRIQKFIIDGELAEAHGKILAGLPEHLQYSFAIQAVSSCLSSRALENLIKKTEKTKNMSNLKNNISADLIRLERNLSDYFCATIKFSMFNPKSGQIMIHFNDLDELDGILKKTGYSQTEMN